MKVCVTQRYGIRSFARFANLAERDKLEIEVRIDDKDGKTVLIDLTPALLEAYARHPDVGTVAPAPTAVTVAAQARKPLAIKKSIQVTPAYLTDSQKQKEDMVAKVRQAQMKAVEEKKQQQAETAAKRAEQLANARKAKAEKEEAAGKTKTTAPSKTVAAKPTPSAKLTATQTSAIQKIGKALAKEDKTKAKPATAKASPGASKGKPSARPAVSKPIAAKRNIAAA